jgi:hypothetical protein
MKFTLNSPLLMAAFPITAALATTVTTAYSQNIKPLTDLESPTKSPVLEESSSSKPASDNKIKEAKADTDNQPKTDADAAKTPPMPQASAADLSDPPPLGELLPDGGQSEEALPADFSQTVTMNLLKALVEEGVLKREKAVALLQQAEREALAARRAEQERKNAEQKEKEEALQISYVPDTVRRQIRDEVKAEVISEIEKVGPNNPLKNITLGDNINVFGDLRLRYESITYPYGNDNTGAFPNFNAINTGSPFDTAGLVFSPQYNTDQDRQRYRMRARLGAEFTLEDDWMVGLRVGTGNDSSPVSTNQTLGGNGGNFSKYQLWLDRIFTRYLAENERAAFTVNLGRFDNPFQSTSIIYDEDLGFDGVAVNLKAKLHKNFQPWITAGAFPIFNTDLNFATNQPAKFRSIDKYLYGAQAGVNLKAGNWSGKLGGAYYLFHNVAGRPSTPYLPLSASDAGDTDHTRPSFAQRGNTYRPLRTIIADPLNNFGTSSQWQYFGLASEFEPASVTARIDYNGWENKRVSFIGEYIKNTAFNRQEIEKVAVNNRGPLKVDEEGQTSGIGVFDGDDTAWIIGMKIGSPALQKRWDWELGVDYRWVGSDAVVDGFVDSEFGGGATNVKGVNLGAKLAITKNATIGLNWMSADQISGPPFRADVFQFDFQVKF